MAKNEKLTQWDLVNSGATVEVTAGEWSGYAGLLESVNIWNETAVVLFNGGDDFATVALASLRLKAAPKALKTRGIFYTV